MLDNIFINPIHFQLCRMNFNQQVITLIAGCKCSKGSNKLSGLCETACQLLGGVFSQTLSSSAQLFEASEESNLQW